jgi:hypothetical protein
VQSSSSTPATLWRNSGTRSNEPQHLFNRKDTYWPQRTWHVCSNHNKTRFITEHVKVVRFRSMPEKNQNASILLQKLQLSFRHTGAAAVSWIASLADCLS